MTAGNVYAQAALPAKQPQNSEQVKFFEARIRPVLVKHCYECHSAQSSELGGGLQLDTRGTLLAGGDSGAAVVPGNPKASLLLKAIQQTDRDLIMPPKEAGPKLSDDIIADFEHWIGNGAVDPRTEAAAAPAKKHDAESAKSWWAWQPRRQVAPPQVRDARWVREPLDRFILAQLEREGMKPSPDADRVTLVRRLAFDLTGLPPTVSELHDFALSPTPLPLGRLVDRYLDSPRYGERMGRRWLDVARYAESTGKEANATFPHAWRYRDYVIDAFSRDISFRDFIVEQIAGDLLPDDSPVTKARRNIATGFLAIGPKSLNEGNLKLFAADLADEQIDAISQAFLGLTIACARCHDHKFDPITQRDYTALAGIFLSTATHFGAQSPNGRHYTTLIELPNEFVAPDAYTTLTPTEFERVKQQVVALHEQQESLVNDTARMTEGNKKRVPIRPPGSRQLNELETLLLQFNSDGSLKALAMGVSDKPPAPLRPVAGRPPRPVRAPRRPREDFKTIADSPLFDRGEITQPGELVPRGLPAFLVHNKQPAIPATTSGRLQLARWIADDANPLTARVIVNRVWSWTMGQGIVSNVDYFGSTSEPPSHPELLDYLANEFVQNGWSVKKLVRTIVLSRTYAMSSEYVAENYARDPDNRNHWRANPRMLEAEAIRDTMLFAAGTLDMTRPQGSLVSRAGDTVINRVRLMDKKRLSEEDIAKFEASYRSIYLPVPRNAIPDTLEVFDFPDNSLIRGSRETTLVPSQSLFWMNSEMVDRVAQNVSQRVLPELEFASREKPKHNPQHAAKQKSAKPPIETPRHRAAHAIDVAAKFDDVCLLTLSRQPLPEELAAVKSYVAEQTRAGVSDETIWRNICRATLSSADFRRLR